MAPGSNKTVYPSGSDLATYSAPMLLPAPGLFSMNTCWPHIAESLSASMRATISVGPPAATGTMMRTGLVGYPALGVCALPASGEAAGAPPQSGLKSRRLMRLTPRPQTIIAGPRLDRRRASQQKTALHVRSGQARRIGA